MKRFSQFAALFFVIVFVAVAVLSYSFVVAQDEPNETGLQYELNETGCLIVPGRSHLYASKLVFPDDVELNAGETKEADIVLETRKDGPGKVSYTVLGLVTGEYSEEVVPAPEGLSITVEPSEFMAYQNQTYVSVLKVETSPSLEKGEYYFYFDILFESVAEGHSWVLVTVT
jgi:hypothetical protein